MKYIVYIKSTNKVLHVLNGKPKATSEVLGVAECENIPNAKHLLVTNLKDHEEIYKETAIDYDDNGCEVAREVEKVKKYQTCEVIEDTATSRLNAVKNEIQELKAKLSATDYIVIKIAEETAYGNEREVEILKTEYSTELANRQVWRKRINELEKGV